MGILSSIFELPQLLSYMFLPTLTEEEWEDLNVNRLVAMFLFGVLVGMVAMSLIFVFNAMYLFF